ncbi:hypothetical protein KKA14_14130 [bacterium]|nr:hypothetical protein [bacterium]
MARKTSRAKLLLSSEEYNDLKRITQSQTKPLREAQRAKILLHLHDLIGMLKTDRFGN